MSENLRTGYPVWQGSVIRIRDVMGFLKIDQRDKHSQRKGYIQIKRDHITVIPFSRGIERIRTAVGAFAELSLAARPRYRFFVCPIN